MEEEIYEILKDVKKRIEKFDDQKLGALEYKYNLLMLAVDECLDLLVDYEEKEILPEKSVLTYYNNSFVSDE